MAKNGAESTRDSGTRTSDAELASLKAQLKQERDEKDQLRAEATQRTRERDDAHRRLAGEVDQRFQVEEDSIKSALEAAKTEADRLEVRVAELNERGEFAEAAKVGREISRLEAKAGRLEDRQEAIAEAKEKMKTQADERAAAAETDPLAGMSDPAKAWIRRHPKWLTDETFRNEVTAAHWKAKARGKALDTDDYFRFIEKEIGEGADDDRDTRGHDDDDRDARRGARDRDDADNPLSDASRTEDAGVEIDEEDGVDLGAGDDMYDAAERTVRRAQDRAREAARTTDRGRDADRGADRDRDGGARREPRRPSNASSGAPPSRGGGSDSGGRSGRDAGRVRLSALQAEVALSSYPPGDYPGIKTKEDAYRRYHAELVSIESEGRNSAGRR